MLINAVQCHITRGEEEYDIKGFQEEEKGMNEEEKNAEGKRRENGVKNLSHAVLISLPKS